MSSSSYYYQNQDYESGGSSNNRGGGFTGARGGYHRFDSRSSTPTSFDGGEGMIPEHLKNLPPIKKDFYKEHPKVAAQSDSEIEAYRREHQMVLQGRGIPKPVHDFDQCGFSLATLRKIGESGFEKPTAIQAQGWPMGLSGRNMVGIAQTGSGKTLSYILPAIIHIKGQEVDSGYNSGYNHAAAEPIALVLAPTRELAIQIQEVARLFGNVERVRNAVAYGGASRGGQLRMLGGAQLVIATPGRLNDFVDSGQVRLERVSFLVLDEADRMLDMGFEPQIRKILDRVRPDRQVLFWSATWPKAVQRLAHDMLGRDFIQVTIGSAELTANNKIKQSVQICSDSDKESLLAELLLKIWNDIPGEDSQKAMPRTIIFTNTKRVAEELTWKLNRDNWPAVAIHGDKSQYEREEALRCFRRGETPIMVATDVAARGLDVKEVRIVVNYDFPKVVEDYVHRIGRTARGNDTEGASFTFFTPGDRSGARELCDIMRDAGQAVPADLEAMVPRRNGNGGFNNRRGGFGGGRGGGYRRGGGGYRPY